MNQTILQQLRKAHQNIPDFTPQDLVEYIIDDKPHLFEVNATPLVDTAVAIIKAALIEFIASEILPPNKSFTNPDKTISLFPAQYQYIKNLNFNNFAPEFDAKILKLAVTLVYLFFSKFENVEEGKDKSGE